MAVKSYNPADVKVILNGVPLSGFADGTFLTAARDNPGFNSITGSDGEGARSKSNDKSGTITLTLLQSSSSNDALSAIAKLDELSGDGIGTLLVKDISGRTVISAQTCWIEKFPDSEFSREISNREWVFKTDSLNVFVGGN